MITTTFTALGKAEPKGSTRSFVPRHSKTGHAVTTSANKNLKPWESVVRSEAVAAGLRPVHAAVRVGIRFFFARPKYHFTTKGGIKPAMVHAPHLVTPDVDKLARAVLDGLTGVAYHDDKQVVGFTELEKCYVPEGGTPCAIITVTQLTELE